jgi:hypothetical protein
MAELTYSVSVVTNGMLSLRSVSLGILRVDSHRLLEDGIRQELVKKVTLALHNSLVFDGKSKVSINYLLFYVLYPLIRIMYIYSLNINMINISGNINE